MVTVCKRYLYIYISNIYAFRCRWMQLYHIDTYNSWNVWTHSCGSIPIFICLSFGRFWSTRVYFIKISNQTLGFASPKITSPDIVDSSTVREKAAYLGGGSRAWSYISDTVDGNQKNPAKTQQLRLVGSEHPPWYDLQCGVFCCTIPGCLLSFPSCSLGMSTCHLNSQLRCQKPRILEDEGSPATQHTKVTGCYSQIEDTVRKFLNNNCCMVLGALTIQSVLFHQFQKQKRIVRRIYLLEKHRRECLLGTSHWIQSTESLNPTDFGGFRCLFVPVTMLFFSPEAKNGFHYGNVFLCWSWWSNPAPSRSSPLFSIAPA